MKYADVYVHSAEQIPKREHWAIISSTSVTIPGDERSRTNPGHGYPEHDEKYIEYAAYFDEAVFKEEFARQSTDRFSRQIAGIHVAEHYTIKTTAEVVKETTDAR